MHTNRRPIDDETLQLGPLPALDEFATARPWDEADWAHAQRAVDTAQKYVDVHLSSTAADESADCRVALDLLRLALASTRKNAEFFLLNYAPLYDWWETQHGARLVEGLSIDGLFEHFARRGDAIVTEWAAPAAGKMRSWFLASAAVRSSFRGRIANKDHWSLVPRLPRDSGNVPQPLAPSTDVMLVLAGESGSGKSTTIVMSNKYGVYLTAQDFVGLALIPAASRDATVRQMVLDAVARCLDEFIPAARRAELGAREGSMVLTVAVDEMGQFGDFVRGLCACQDAVRGDIRAMLGVKHDANLQIVLVVCGTGIDAQSTTPGSLATKYRLLTMELTSDTADLLIDHAKQLSSNHGISFGCGSPATSAMEETAKLMTAALRADTLAMRLAQNPRYAALLYGAMVATHFVLHNKEQARMHVRRLLPVAAYQYKLLNGMSEDSAAEVAYFFNRAARLIFGGPHISCEGPADMVLSTVKGVVVDRARWVECSRAQRLKDEETHVILLASDPANPTFSLVCPVGGRFEMSPAQQLLFRMQYGFAEMPVGTWEGFEDAVADYLTVALVGCRGRTLGDLLRSINRHSMFVEAMKDSALLSRRLVYDGVAELRTPSKHNAVTIGKETTAGDLRDVKELADKRTAVVIVNAPLASYADVIAVIPNVAVLVVQCKFYQDNTALSKDLIIGELAKMDATVAASTSLLEIAGLCATDIVPVMATTKPCWEKDTFVLWRPRENGLAPLATPVPLAPVSRSAAQRVVTRAFEFLVERVADNEEAN